MLKPFELNRWVEQMNRKFNKFIYLAKHNIFLKSFRILLLLLLLFSHTFQLLIQRIHLFISCQGYEFFISLYVFHNAKICNGPRLHFISGNFFKAYEQKKIFLGGGGGGGCD